MERATEPQRYRITIDGQARTVEIGPGAVSANGSVTVTIDGHARTLDVRRVGAGTFSIIEGGAARLIQVSGSSPKLTIEVSHPDGEPRTLIAEVAEEREASSSGSASSRAGASGRTADGTIRSPIPGKVVKVLVHPGDAAKAGQPVMVIEAMKMENELRAPRDGRVEKVTVREGQAVEAGETLVELQ